MSNNLYDLSGVLRYQQGSAQTPWRIEAAYNEAELYLTQAEGCSFSRRHSRQRGGSDGVGSGLRSK